MTPLLGGGGRRGWKSPDSHQQDGGGLSGPQLSLPRPFPKRWAGPAPGPPLAALPAPLLPVPGQEGAGPVLFWPQGAAAPRGQRPSSHQMDRSGGRRRGGAEKATSWSRASPETAREGDLPCLWGRSCVSGAGVGGGGEQLEQPGGTEQVRAWLLRVSRQCPR